MIVFTNYDISNHMKRGHTLQLVLGLHCLTGSTGCGIINDAAVACHWPDDRTVRDNVGRYTPPCICDT